MAQVQRVIVQEIFHKEGDWKEEEGQLLLNITNFFHTLLPLLHLHYLVFNPSYQLQTLKPPHLLTECLNSKLQLPSH